MAGSSMKKLRKQKIQQQLKVQNADKQAKEFTGILRDEIAKMSEEELNELSQAILDLANEEEPTMEQVEEVVDQVNEELKIQE